MRRPNRAAVIVLGLTLSPPLSAGTLIEGHDDQGNAQRILWEPPRARIDTGEPGGYLIVDVDKGRAYAVSTEDKQALDLSPMLGAQQQTHAAADRATILKQGAGPAILGYDTDHYRLMVGDKVCYDEYISPQALEKTRIAPLLQALARLSGGQEDPGDGDAPGDPYFCYPVERLAESEYTRLGLPLRTIHTGGTVIHEITRIQTDAHFESSELDLPAGYTIMKPEELMRRAMERDDPASRPHNPGESGHQPAPQGQ